jgi:FkbM family methyltransferase
MSAVRQWRKLCNRTRLWALGLRARLAPRHRSGRIRVAGLDIQYVDLLSFYMEYKDIFVQGIYHFRTEKAAPRIIDGGGCIGVSVLYFKQVYPAALITCFEPDPEIFRVLQRNVSANKLKGVELVQAGLAGGAGRASFLPDGLDGGRITDGPADGQTIPTVPLSPYLGTEVDFLKLNIEGQELPVLQEAEASGRLRNVRELVLEYHGWPGGDQRLGPILDLLDRQGFRYLVHDFDEQTCGMTKPPFSLTPQTTWFCLVYARRV